MATIITRASKGTELTHEELDLNLTNLNDFKVEKSNNNTHGAFLYFANSVDTTISTAGTFQKISGTTTQGGSNGDVDITVDNRIKYTGTTTKFFLLDISAVVSTPSNSQTIAIKIAINGVVQDFSEMKVFCKTGTEQYNITANVFAQLTQNDYIEVFATNENSASTVTVHNLHFRSNSIYTS